MAEYDFGEDDLEKSDTILESHITEAVRFRSVDRKYWGVETI